MRRTNTQSIAFLFVVIAGVSSKAAEPLPVTFARDIAPVIHEKCTICHREGQPGPFELVTYDDVRERAETIQAVVHDQYMPPWKPVNEGVQYANDRRLSEREKKMLDQWIETGTPTGDLQSIQYPSFHSGWSLGEPDLVLRMTGKFEVPASGPDIYRSFVLPANLPEDKWVKAIELRPTARGAVHHALFFIDTSGEARQEDGQDGKPGLAGMSFLRQALTGDERSATRGLGGYVPGAMPNKLPGDLAMLLPKGGDIVMQTHFHPSGKTEWEQAELALYFADKAPTRQLVPIQLPPLFGRLAGLDVPAGQKDFEITETLTLPVGVEAIGISGHAHYICREMEMKATLPSGKVVDLLTIDDWDLDWQDQYQFKEPIPLPAGTRLDARILYDNSEENLENPNSPPKRIRWGRESTDEMGSLTLQVVAASESDRPQLMRATKALLIDGGKNQLTQGLERFRSGLRSQKLDGTTVKALDKNADGKLQKTEVPERVRDRVFQFADRNNDDVIDETELKQIMQILENMKR
jgi:hypothetical protein